MISESEAIKRAEHWLIRSNVSFEGRKIKVSRMDVYKVVFLLPPGMLGGDFTLFVDPVTGEVIKARLER